MYLNANTSLGLNLSDTSENTAVPNSRSVISFIGIFILCFYIIVYSTSTVGNFVVLYICHRSGRSAAFKPTRTGFFNRYIANLAIADLLFTQLTVFDAVYAILADWVFGAAMCKLQGFLVELCYSAAILTLIAISRERRKSISDLEMKSRIQRIKERKIFSIIVWIVAFVLCSPLLYAYNVVKTQTENGISRCNNIAWLHIGRRIYYSITIVILFVFPLTIMIWTQLKIKRFLNAQVVANQQIAALTRARQKKASRMLSSVTLVFFVLWSPFILTRTLRYFAWYEGEIMWKLSQLLTLASSAANPFIYSFYSLHYRIFIKRLITCQCRRFMAKSENVPTSTAISLY